MKLQTDGAVQRISSRFLFSAPTPFHPQFSWVCLQVKEAYDRLTEEVVEVRAALSQSQQKEKKFGSLVQELTAVVKEQKNRIAEIVRTKREAVGGLRVRGHPSGS